MISNLFTIPQAESSLDIWLSYLTKLHSQSIDMGLERVRQVMEKMELTQPATRIITVTGTNGKGTTCHAIESILIAAGIKVGVYSSPHLVNYTERVRIQGQELPESVFCRVFANIESERGNISLTYFEYSTLAALMLFKESVLDVVILEVGLGGLLDATNIINSDVTAITSIALDHTDWLGSDRERIGYQKAGIFRENCYSVIGEPDMPRSIGLYAKKINTSLFRREKEWSFYQKDYEWTWQSIKDEWHNLPLPNIPLDNAATALGVISCIKTRDYKLGSQITNQAIYNGLKSAQLPGRFQIINKRPLIILDVAHNPHAASYLVTRLGKLSPVDGRRIRAVIGMLSDKDIQGTLACLSKKITDWYIAPLTELRGASVLELNQYLDSPRVFNSVSAAWLQACLDATDNDIIIVCGSFYTVAHVLMLLKTNK
ncbi:Dihydrofolate synthase/folylpolyglutamate synthase [Candidatus Hartigia pinicola]|nr:Dihydrofolate synthase/folylpolyglutamate synthase [Candidatus Hartigia pinicola]